MDIYNFIKSRRPWFQPSVVLGRSVTGIIFLAVGVFGGTGSAQGLDENEAALRAEQSAFFDRLQAKPDDLDAMFSYAVISIKLRDYEQAIATLERILIYRDDLLKVKLELGSAYFRLGSYEVAKFYFNEVLDGDPTADLRARADEFLVEISRRSQISAFSASTSFGVVYSTNANLGPSERGVVVFGLDAQLDPDFVKQGDVGLRGAARLRHRYDLGRPNDDIWISEASFVTLHYLDETDGDLDVLAAKTGPRFALTDESAGPKIRPFVDANYVRSGGDYLYLSGGGGVELEKPLSKDSLIFGTAAIRYSDFATARNAHDGFIYYGQLGVQHRLDGDTILRGAVGGAFDDARADFNSNFELGGQFSLVHNYETGFDFAGGQPWSIVGFGTVAGRWYVDADPVVDPDETRRDLDARLGISHHARFPLGWSIEISASFFNRSSNIQNFELDNFEVGAFVGKSF